MQIYIWWSRVIQCWRPPFNSLPVCLKETCRKLHALIDKVDEERYDLQTKVSKAEKEVHLNKEAPVCSLLLIWLGSPSHNLTSLPLALVFSQLLLTRLSFSSLWFIWDMKWHRDLNQKLFWVIWRLFIMVKRLIGFLGRCEKCKLAGRCTGVNARSHGVSAVCHQVGNS